MSINSANALRYGLPIVKEDLYQKCNSLHYKGHLQYPTIRRNASFNIELTQYRFRDADAEVFNPSSNNYDNILCLYYEGKCVSSVVGKLNADTKSIEIASQTSPDFAGRKFNLYLRTAYMYLMCFVRPSIRYIVSYSTNPISTYTMYKYYRASNDDLNAFINKNKITHFSFEDAKHFHNNQQMMTWKKAEDQLDGEMADGHVLEEYNGAQMREEAIEFIMETAPKDAIPLYYHYDNSSPQFLLGILQNIPIQCPSIGGGNNRSLLYKMPYTLRKVRNKKCYSVVNKRTKKKHAKCSTKKMAERQIRLLQAVDHGFIPKKTGGKININDHIIDGKLKVTNEMLRRGNLKCDGLDITELDLSDCNKLLVLMCSKNQLTSLDLSNCPSIEFIMCADNKSPITEIKLFGCNELNFLSLHNSQVSLDVLDISDCPQLMYLNIEGDDINTLDVSKEHKNTLTAFHPSDKIRADYHIPRLITKDIIKEFITKRLEEMESSYVLK